MKVSLNKSNNGLDVCEFTYMIISNWHGLHVFKFQVSEFIVVERFTEIERENRILLEKMTNILQNPKGISHANAHLMQAQNP